MIMWISMIYFLFFDMCVYFVDIVGIRIGICGDLG